MAYTGINKSTDFFNTKIYTGNYANGHAITGVGFQPDLVWTKDRSDTSYHLLTDAVRGVTKSINSHLDSAEATSASHVQSFDSDGFTVGQSNALNQSGVSNVAWNWKANGSGSANTDGSTNSTVSVNTTAGFSIVKYAGADAVRTVGHGLGVKPNVIFVKRYGSSGAWQVYHSSLGATKYLRLDSTSASDTSTARWNDTEPTSSVFTLSTSAHVNESGDYIAYCFADKTGFSRSGIYKGNASNNGTYIHLGFKPAWVFTKSIDTTSNWNLFDNKRSPINEVNDYHKMNVATAEDTNVSDIQFDFLSNGLKIRGDNDEFNGGSSEKYFYMAFAEAPLVGSNNIPCTAR